jgi:antitoxin component of MazEF toxin-antitoxin module
MKMTTIRKWGDSLAVTISPEEIKHRGLKEGDEVEVRIYKKLNNDLFGVVPRKYRMKISGQSAKDMLREEW